MTKFDLATVCKWIGNSPAVAAKHNAMSSDLSADFARAAGQARSDETAPHRAQHNEQQPPSAGDRQGVAGRSSEGRESGDDQRF